MREIMMRAWEIVRATESGTLREKLSAALKQAWAEAKAEDNKAAGDVCEEFRKLRAEYIGSHRSFRMVKDKAVEVARQFFGEIEGKKEVVINGIETERVRSTQRLAEAILATSEKEYKSIVLREYVKKERPEYTGFSGYIYDDDDHPTEVAEYFKKGKIHGVYGGIF